MKAVISCQLLVISFLLITGCLPLATAVHGQIPAGTRYRIESYTWLLKENVIRWTATRGRINAQGEYEADGAAETCALSLTSVEADCGGAATELPPAFVAHLEDDVYGFLEHLYQLSGGVREGWRAGRC